jgi:hypothetical protein
MKLDIDGWTMNFMVRTIDSWTMTFIKNWIMNFIVKKIIDSRTMKLDVDSWSNYQVRSKNYYHILIVELWTPVKIIDSWTMKFIVSWTMKFIVN